ncbi:MAG: exodeoxyribonuclease VII large subunit [Trichodesmium sp. St15_bin1_1]|jgi:exodeoxyribonuclease VII large subunit|nr:exodeoxyribonuclease VII large subunit [Trichodesmium sp. MAG_R02]MDE5086026.1 exodeoxyribonuclease VII large subunit [Trichodesmium sp. St16_bin2-tuft]MDE5112788.1 exodeoxyribonuclease VII large subunit [Trichodesmium sp. St15_bin1_1]
MSGNIPEQFIEKPPISVAGITFYIKEILEQDYQLQQISVIGEVSSTNLNSGSLYFTLSESDNSASIPCAIWRNTLQNIHHQPQKGEQIIVTGTISFYLPRGNYKLIVNTVYLAGEGIQNLRYLQLRSRLKAEGLFDQKNKRTLPKFPKTLAVVTSDNAAAWGDIKRTIKQRYPLVKILLSPTLVQGEFAPITIVEAIQRVELDGRAEVIILARGGGAIEDLSCFNDERVIRVIADCKIPIITGIGHQRDETLTDLVADYSAHTPTAAAEKVVPNQNQLYDEYYQIVARIIDALRTRLNEEKANLKSLKNRLKNIPQTSITLDKAIVKYQILKQKLAALNPRAVLSRGYAVVQKTDGKLVNSTTDLSKDQELIIQLNSGKVKVKIMDLFESESQG